MIIPWLHRRREAARLANADAEALIRDHGGAAYWEARRRERDVIIIALGAIKADIIRFGFASP